MYLTLRGDLSDPGETLLKPRAPQSFEEAASLLEGISAARDERNEPANAVTLAADLRSMTPAALYRLVNTG